MTSQEQTSLLIGHYKSGSFEVYHRLGSKKIVAFIGQNSDGYFYAFGKPSQQGGYIAFNTQTVAEAENKIVEHLTF